jgi:hypothetical protein
LTIVLQSFRAYDVPEWIKRCMHSVRQWGKGQRFCYRFVGDELLGLPPDWFRQKAGRYTTVITDLARLLCIRQYLAGGADRVLWIDADVVIFRPDSLRIDPELSYAYAKEIWCWKDENGGIQTLLKINNAACVFRNTTDGLAHLNEYIDHCLSTVEQTRKIADHTLIGTRHLTAQGFTRLPVLPGFGLLSPAVMNAILTGDNEVLARFAQQHDGPVCAANLCNFFRSKSALAERIGDDVFSAVVDKLLETSGQCLDLPA